MSEPDANGWFHVSVKPSLVGHYNVWFDAEEELGYIPAVRMAWWDGIYWDDDYRSDDGCQPTHWQPLPKPPIANPTHADTKP